MYPEEESQRRTIELISFRRVPGESIDDALSRLEMLRHSADSLHGFGMPAGTLSWFLLHGLSIPRMSWPMILQGIGGG